MGAVPKKSKAKDPRFSWESDVSGPAIVRALKAPLRALGIGTTRHEGVVTRKVRQPFKQLFPDAKPTPGYGTLPTNVTWIFLDGASLPVGWIGRPPPKAPDVGDRVRLAVSPVSGVLIRAKVVEKH